MGDKRYYWQSVEDLSAFEGEEGVQAGVEREFKESIPLTDSERESRAPTRRDFLKAMGFGFAAASFAGCEAPIRKAIPYLNKPVDIEPGVPNYYATTYIDGSDCCGVIVKTREGRPIKLSPHRSSSLSGTGLSSQVEASLLGLYDGARHRHPFVQEGDKREAISWSVLDERVISALESAKGRGEKVYLVSHSIVSPSTRAAISRLVGSYGGDVVSHVMYDAISYSALLDVHARAFNVRALPTYRFDKASVIVSLEADFLSTWMAPTMFARQFSTGRKLGGGRRTMNRLYVLEAGMSLTGANADHRIKMHPGLHETLLEGIYHALLSLSGGERVSIGVPKEWEAVVWKIADALWGVKQKGLLVSGRNSYRAQAFACAINQILGGYGATLSLSAPLYTKQGDDRAMGDAMDAILQKRAYGVICYNCNPVYEHAQGVALAEAFASLPFSLSTSISPDETSTRVKYVAPDHHYLESWNDAEPIGGELHLSQPVISPLFNTRQVQDSLLIWGGEGGTEGAGDYSTFLQSRWRLAHYRGKSEGFSRFWKRCLYDGVYRGQSMWSDADISVPYRDVVAGLGAAPKASSGGLGFLPYVSASLLEGNQANNPWLWELPDPITRHCWGQVLTLPPGMAKDLGIVVQDNITTALRIELAGRSYVLPAIIQPGQVENTVGIAVGYGRTEGGPVATGSWKQGDTGVNVFHLLRADGEGHVLLESLRVPSISVAGKEAVALIQTTSTYAGRNSVIQETTLSDYRLDEGAGRYHPKISTSEGKKSPGGLSLWKGHAYAQHHWGMAIDLNSCTGCQACVLSCQVENNIAVVGKQEVVRRREMHWLRIDRYYSHASTEGVGGIAALRRKEEASDNPAVVFQPMLCQHCNHAPCETVCPVAATTHSSEGLNQMTYNRCVGTRYCANNCPYKVRRFNWFKYHDNDVFAVNTPQHSALGKMVLNPDVTVRSRGVMEKCSFCVQRIQSAKLHAKKEKRGVRDGEAQTACAQSCPTEAIVFGDMKDKTSKISQLLSIEEVKEGESSRAKAKEPRAYHVLEELNVQPNVWYLTKVRNTEKG